MRIEYHRTLIADRLRTKAFHDALRQVIVPGETLVADIGAGTGILGFLAARLGAKRVILYESEEIASLAKKLAKANKIRNFEIMPCHSTEIANPEQVDVIVSETLGNFATEENIVATITDARTRHLKRGGTIIPSRIVQFVAPVVTDRVQTELSAWGHVHDDFGLDFSRARTMSFNNIYVRRFTPAEVLAPVTWDTIDLMRDTRSNRSGEASWPIKARVTIHGFAVWWQATLVPGITLATGPGDPETHWEQLYLPLLEPITATARETVALTLRSRSAYDSGTDITWTATHLDASGKPRSKQALDLEKGFLP